MKKLKKSGKKTKSVSWTPEAREDRASIRDYIKPKNKYAALSLLGEIIAKVRKLPAFPQMGRPGRIPGTREIIVKRNYIIVYQVTASTIRVLRIRHARQDWPN